MDSLRLRVSVRVVSADQGIQFSQDRYLGTRLSGFHICIEAGNISSLCEGVAKIFKELFHVCVGLPFMVSSLGAGPDVTFCL